MREMAKRRGAIAGAVALLATFGALEARAQDVPPGCVASGNPNGAAAGALVGGVAGALLGNAVSGRRKEGGTILGGVTGALAGAAIGGSTGGAPCPQGYAYRAAPERDVDVAPRRLRDDDSAPRRLRDDDPPPRRVYGDEPPPRRVRYDDVWYGAPPRIHERIVFMRQRIEKLDGEGWLSPRESDGLRGRIAEIADREARIRDNNDGRLPPEMRARLDDDLNGVARKLRWKEYRTQHAEE